MKTLKILTISLFLCIAGDIIAQQDGGYIDNRDRLQLGITGGLNISNVYDEGAHNFVAGSLIGGVFGGYLSIPIGTYLGVQPEVLYSQKGYSMVGTDIFGPYSYIKRSNYIDVPILFQFKPIPEIYLLAGPEYSYLTSNSVYSTNSLGSSYSEQQFSNDNLRHNTLGVMLGTDLNMGQFTFGVRVAWDLQDNNGDGTSYEPRYRNYLWQFEIGFRL